jgi:XapX domain-containing protein
MIKIVIGLVLSLIIGAACRGFDIPVPSPPKLMGALLVVAMSIGYMATDRLMATKFASRGPAATKDLCGGPTRHGGVSFSTCMKRTHKGENHMSTITTKDGTEI